MVPEILILLAEEEMMKKQRTTGWTVRGKPRPSTEAFAHMKEMND